MTKEYPEELKEIYARLYALTKLECQHCRVPHSCCSPEYGEMAKEIMLEFGQEVPPSTKNPRCQFLDSNGKCLVQPHFRPLCTRHTCDINSLGFKPKDPKWTEAYFDLTEKIAVLETTALEDRSTS